MKNLIEILLIALALFSCQKEKKLFVTVYGHAGTSIFPERAIHPDNTKESVLYALDVLDADGVEVDVQMTKDSVLVLYHDQYLDTKTNASGCVGNYNWEELSGLEFHNSRYAIVRLSEIVDICNQRKAMLFLDIKHFNFCNEEEVNYGTFNYALNKDLEGLSNEEKARITVNSRSLKLLVWIEANLIKKSFETKDVDLGIEYAQTYFLDKICLNLADLSEDKADLLREKDIPFCIFGLKTQKEIKEAYGLYPEEMISDNIPYAKKQSN